MEFFNDKKIFFKYINSSVNDNFNVMVIGYEKMDADTPAKGPFFKTHFTLHYCLSGKGTFTVRNNNYNIEKGDMFLIPPNVVVKYRQDPSDPWEYIWYEFCGNDAYTLLSRTRLNENTPVCRTADENVCKPLLASFDGLDNETDGLICTGNLYLFFGRLIREQYAGAESEKRSEKAILDDMIKYADDNFMRPQLTLNEISRIFHINKSYLARVFKAKTNVTVSHYILMLRINKACKLLRGHDLSVKTVAYSVGFTDALYFSKKFKEVIGVPPSDFYSLHQVR